MTLVGAHHTRLLPAQGYATLTSRHLVQSIAGCPPVHTSLALHSLQLQSSLCVNSCIHIYRVLVPCVEILKTFETRASFSAATDRLLNSLLV